MARKKRRKIVPKKRKPTKRTKKARKPTKKTPQVKREAKKQTQWRDRKTGKFTPRPRTARQRRERRREVMTYRVDTIGRHTTGFKYHGFETQTKTVSTAALGEYQGLIWEAMESVNMVSAVTHPRAVAVDITISGVANGVRKVIKFSLDLADIKRRGWIDTVLVAQMVEAMHNAGVRPQYSIQMIQDWTHKKTRRKDAARYAELKGMMITALVRYK